MRCFMRIYGKPPAVTAAGRTFNQDLRSFQLKVVPVHKSLDRSLWHVIWYGESWPVSLTPSSWHNFIWAALSCREKPPLRAHGWLPWLLWLCRNAKMSWERVQILSPAYLHLTELNAFCLSWKLFSPPGSTSPPCSQAPRTGNLVSTSLPGRVSSLFNWSLWHHVTLNAENKMMN